MGEEKIFYIFIENDVDFTSKYAKQLNIPFVRWDISQDDSKGSIFHIHIKGIQNQHDKERAEKLALSVFSGKSLNLGEVSELTNMNRPADHNLKGAAIDIEDFSGLIVKSQLGKPIQKTAPPAEEQEIDDLGTLAPLDVLLSKPIPPVEWLVNRLMVKGGITIFAGEPKSGKTFLAQTLALSLVAGRPFMDVFDTKPCKVLYVDEENGKIFILNRFKQLVAGKENPQKLNELIVGINNDVKIDSEDMTALTSMVTKHTPDVVVIDSVVRCMVGDEDRASDVRKVFDNLKKLKSLGISILLLHHTTKADTNSVKGIRGSGDWGAMIDVVAMVTIRKRDKLFCLEVVRNRHDQVMDTDNFKFSISGDEEKIELSHEGCITHEKQSVIDDLVDGLKKWIQDNRIKAFKTSKAVEIAKDMGYKRDNVADALNIMLDDRHIFRQKQGYYEVIDPILLSGNEEFVGIPQN